MQSSSIIVSKHREVVNSIHRPPSIEGSFPANAKANPLDWQRMMPVLITRQS